MTSSKKTISNDGQPMLSARKVAARLKCAPDYVSKLCREGKLLGEQIGGQWFVIPSSIEEFESARALAKEQRSAQLAEQRRSEKTSYKIQNGTLIEQIFLRVKKVSVGAPIGMAVGASLLVCALVFASSMNVPQQNQYAAISEAQSPFFGTQAPAVVLPTHAGNAFAGATNFLSNVFATLFGGKAKVAVVPSQKSGLSQRGEISAEIPPTSGVVTPAYVSSKPVSAAAAPSVVNNYPVVERVVERSVAVGGVTQEQLNGRLEDLYNRLAVQISFLQNPGHESPHQNFAVSQVINNLSDVRLNNTTTADDINAQYVETKRLFVSGTSNLAGDVTIQNSLTAGTTTLSNLTVLGNATTTGNFFLNGGSLTVTGDTVLANATSTNFFATTASSTNLFAQTGTIGTLNAQTINLSGVSSFFGGFLSLASSTVGNGTQTGGLTINGGATTTGNAYIAGGLGVGVATSAPGTLQVANNAYFGGDLFVGGNTVTLGNSSSNSLVINSSIKSNITPDQNIQYDLGSPSFYWKNVYVGNVIANNISAASTTIAGTASATFTINSDNVSADAEDMDLIFFRGNVVPNALISWKTAAKRFEINQALYIANQSGSLTTPTLQLQGVAGQTGDILRISSSTGTTMFAVGPLGVTLTQGFISQASSTIGDGTQAGGLTVSGGATTTGNLYVGGALTVSGSFGISGLTQNRVPFVASGSQLVDSANFTYSGSTLSVASGVIQSTSGIFRGDDQWHQIILHNAGNNSDYFEYGDTLAANGGHRFFTGGTSQTLRFQIANDGIYAQGPFGIGTTSTNASLTIDNVAINNPALFVTKSFSGGGNGVIAAKIVGTDAGVADTGLYITQKGSGGLSNPGNFVIQTVANGIPLLTQLYNGNVGIGTTSPWAKLSVEGTSSLGNQAIAGYFTATSTTASSFAGGFLSLASSTIGNGTLGLTVNGPATTTGRAYFAGNVGIGTTSPWRTFSVNGNSDLGVNALAGYFTATSTTASSFAGGLTAFASSTIGNNTQNGGLTVSGGATTTGNAYFAGNVGIGTTSPWRTLSVKGSSDLGTSALAGFFTATSTTASSFAGGFLSLASSTIGNGNQNGGLTIFGGATTTGNLLVSGNATSSAFFATTASSTNLFAQLAAFGTLTAQSLSVSGTTNYTGLATFTNGFLSLASSTIGNGTLGLTVNGPATTTGRAYFAGNVGVGTTSPWRTFSVNGNSDLGVNALAGYFTATSTTATSTFAAQLLIGSSTSAALSANGAINSAEVFSIYNSSVLAAENKTTQASGQGAQINLYQNDGTAMLSGSRLGGLVLGGASSATALRNTATLSAFAENNWTDGADYATYLRFETTAPGSTSRTEKVRITGAGNLGIGTTSPWAKLSVEGTSSLGNQAIAGYFTATSTTASSFAGGFTAFASSTIGNGTLGLTVNGAATTTGNAYVAGNVGIGNVNPIASLNVTGTNYAQEGGLTNPAGISFGVSGGSPRISLDNGNGAANSLGNQWNIDNSAGNFRVFTAGNVRFTIQSGGNVGIGSSSPSAGLAVVSDSTTRFAVEGSTANGVMRDIDVDSSGVVTLGTYYKPGDGYLLKVNTPTKTVEIGGESNLRFLKASPGGYLFDSANYALISGAWDGAHNYKAFGYGSNTITFNDTNAGSLVGVGTTTPWAKFSVSATGGGSAPLFAVASSTSGLGTSTAFLIAADGSASFGGAVTANSTLTVSGNTVLANATSSAFFATTASSTNLFAQLAAFGTLTAQSLSVSGTTNYTGLATFTNGFLSLASSTIGNGTQTGGLTVNGGATTTGNAYFAGNVGIGSTSPSKKLVVTSGIFATGVNQSAVQFDFTGTSGALGFGRTLNSAGGSTPYMESVSTSLGSTVGFAINPFGVGSSYVAIGTTTGYAALSVQGGGSSATSRAFELSNSASTTLFLVDNAGNINAGVSTATTTISGGLAVGSQFRTLQNGNTAIGTTGVLGNYGFEISGSAFYVHQSNGSNNLYIPNTGSGISVVSGATPLSGLSVGTNASIGSAYAGTFAAPSNGLIVAGTTGIGTSSPFAKLSIHANNGDTNTTLFAIGSSTASATTTLFSISNTGAITSTGTFTTSGLSTFTNGFLSLASSTIGNGTQTGGLTVNGGATTTGNAYFAGNVGIGTQTPSNKLQVSGGGVSLDSAATIVWGTSSPSSFTADSSKFTFNVGNGMLVTLDNSARFGPSQQSTTNVPGTDFTLFGGTPEGTSADQNGGALVLKGGTSRGTGTSQIQFFTAASGSSGVAGNTPAQRAVITGSGSFGIGTTSPWRTLSVNGNSDLGVNALAGSFTATSTTASSFAGGFLSLASSTIGNGTQTGGLTVNGGATTTGNAYFAGNVGIGTTAPQTIFAISGPTQNQATIADSVTGNQIILSAGTGNQEIKTSSGNLNLKPFTGQTSIYSAASDAMLVLYTANAAAVGARVSANNTSYFNGGNVGIGTTSPWAKLSVEGTSSLGNQAIAGYFTATSTTASTFAGSVGVGTTTPYGMLSIYGDAGAQGPIFNPSVLLNVAAEYGSTIAGVSVASVARNAVGQQIDSVSTLGAGYAAIGQLITRITAPNNGAAFGLLVDTVSNTSGAQPANVVGGYFANITANSNGNANGLSIGAVTYSGSNASSYASGLQIANSITNTNTAANAYAINSLSTAKSYFAGNIGVGTTSPWATLSVEGTSSLGNQAIAGYFTATSTTASTFAGGLTSSATTTSTYFAASIIGTAGAPAFAFTGDLNTGMYNIGADQLGLTAGGTLRAQATANGFGIGAAPSTVGNSNTALVVQGTGSQENKMVIQSEIGTNAVIEADRFGGSIGASGVLRFSKQGGLIASPTSLSGNDTIGLIDFQVRNTGGLASPAQITAYVPGSANNPNTPANLNFLVSNGLDTSAKSALIITAGAASAVNYLQIANSATLSGPTISAQGTDTDINLNFTPKGAGNSIFTAGNVGIGTTSPWAKLSVEGTSSLGNQAIAGYFTATSTTASSFAGGFTAFASTTIGNGTQIGGLTVNGGATTTGNAYFAGNVGIGTTTPLALLDVGTFNASNATIRTGSLEIQSQGLNNSFIGENAYFDGSKFAYRRTGAAGLLYLSGKEGGFRFAASGTAGANAGMATYQLKTDNSGAFAVGPSVSGSVGNFSGATFSVSAAGTAYLSGSLGVGTTSPWRTLSVNGNSDLGVNALAGSFTATSSAATSTFAGGLTVGTNGLTVFPNGFVGVGATSTPSYNLSVVGSASFGSAVSTARRFDIDSSGSVSSYYGDNSNRTIWTVYNQGISGVNQGNNIAFRMSSTTANSLLGASIQALTESTYLTDSAVGLNFLTGTQGNPNSTLALNSNRNVGISTSTPWARLSVVAAGTGTGYTIMAVNNNGTPIFNVQDNGNVGVGTSTPAGIFDAYGTNARYFTFGSNGRATFVTNDNSAITPSLTLQNSFDGGFGAGILFKLGYGGTASVIGTALNAARIGVIEEQTWTSTASTQDAAMKFDVTLDGTLAEAARITSAGNFGIGTTSPWRTLSVNGNSDLGVNALAGSFTATSTTATSSFAGGFTVGSSALTIFPNGFVGVGTTSPSSAFSVNGNAYFVNGVGIGETPGANPLRIASASSVASVYTSSSVSGIKFLSNNGGGSYIGFGAFNNGANSRLGLGYTTSSGATTLTENLSLVDTGNTGISTTSPFAKLSIQANNGETNTTLFAIGSSTATATTTLFTVSNAGIVSATSTGRIGFAGRGFISSSADGRIDTLASDGTAATFLKIGSSAAGGIALKNNGGVQLTITRADETTGVSLQVANLRLSYGTLASLGAASSLGNGGFAVVNDLLNPVLGATAAGSGTNAGIVMSDGTNWSVLSSLKSRIQVGTTSPFAALSVHANPTDTYANTTLFAIGSSTATATTTLFSVDNTGGAALGAGTPISGANTLSIGADNNVVPEVIFSQGRARVGWGSSGLNLLAGTSYPIIFATNLSGNGLINTASAQMILSTTGNLGVGSTSPFARLAVKGAGTGTSLNFQATDANDAPLFTILDSGNVGVGTVNPTSRLEVNGDIRISAGSGGRLYFADGSSMFTATANGTGITSWNDLNMQTGGQFNVQTGNGNATTTKLLVSNAGFVGIGTTTPFGLLSINPDGVGNAPAFVIGSSTQTNFIVDVTGKVGIGTAAPAVTLDVQGSSNQLRLGTGAANSFFIIDAQPNVFTLKEGASATEAISFNKTSHYINFTTNSTETMRLNSAGSLGIGSTTPLARLSVDTSSLAAGVPAFAVGSSTVSDMLITQDHRVLFGTASNANSSFFKIQGFAGATSAETIFELHAPSASPWMFRYYNDANSPTTAVLSGFAFNSTGTGNNAGVLANDYLLSANTKLLFTVGNASNASNSISIKNIIAGGSNAIGLGIGTTSPTLAYLTVATPMAATGGVPNMFLIASSTPTATTTLFAVNNQGDVTITGANGATSVASSPVAGFIANMSGTIFNVSASGVSLSRAATSNNSQLLVQGSTNVSSAGVTNVAAGLSVTTSISTGGGSGKWSALLVNPTLTVGTNSGGGTYLASLYEGTTASTSRGLYLTAGNMGNNLGVGSTSPFAKLSVHAQNGDLNTTLFAIGSSTATATSTLFAVDNIGNVMVGTTSPAYTGSISTPLMSVAGGLQVGRGGFGFNGIDIVRQDGQVGVGVLRWNNSSSVFQLLNQSGGGVLQLGAVSSAGTATQILGANTAVLATFVNTNQMFGLSTSTPFAKMAISLQNGESYPSNNAFLIASSTASATTTLFSVTNGGLVTIKGNGTNFSQIGDNGFGNAIVLNGSALSGTNYNFYSSVSDTRLLINRPSTKDMVFLENNATQMVLQGTTGNLGIATTSPWAKLSVEGTSTLGNQAIAGFFTATSTTASSFAGGFTAFASSTIGNGTLGLTVNGPATTTGRAYFAGNVGIGTTTPVSNLTVVGSGCFSVGAGATVACGTTPGNIYYTAANTGNYDVAERYATNDQTLAAGDVVALDPQNPLYIEKAKAGAKTFGVISSNPGLILGGADALAASTTKPVALSGRVPVKVNLEGGDIAVGDSIVLSSTDGVATKATSATYRIGVALQPWTTQMATSSNTGIVEVFIKSDLYVSDMALDTLSSIATSTTQTLTASSTSPVSGFSSTLSSMINGLGSMVVRTFNGAISATVGIFNKVYAKELHTDQLCISDANGETCITKTQLDSLLSGVGASQGNGGGNNGGGNGGNGGNATSTDTVAPTIILQGNNPATISIGSTYSDMGATVTDNVDQNLGFQVSVDGGPRMDISALTLDTSTSTTYTILFSATDAAGNTGTATRTVIVQ